MKTPKEKFGVIAKDYNSPFIRNWLFCCGISKYPKLLGIIGPTMAIISRKDEIKYCTIWSTWQKAHDDLKAKALKNYRIIEKFIDKANRHGEKMNNWTEKHIFKADLTKVSTERLIALYEKFADLQSSEYTYGIALPILDFQGFSLVEGSLVKFLKQKVPAKKYQQYYSIFTEPSYSSFALDQEESLLKIIGKYISVFGWKKSILKSDLNEIRRLYPTFFQELQNHTQRFAWVYYVYKGPAYTEQNFLDFIKDYLERKVNPHKRLKEMRDKLEKTERLKQKYVRELRPDTFNKNMLLLAGKLIWAKPRRKDYQSKSYYHVEKLQKEIGRRLNLSLQQVRSEPIQILKKALQSKTINIGWANRAYNLNVCVRDSLDSVAILHHKRASQFIQKCLMPEIKNARINNIKEFRGQTAFSGKVKGVVKIVNRTEDMAKMKQDDILVSIATTPSVVPAMKKATAIVTDEGGLTCHAAIVSRELKIPCVVGTKIATQALKDGDLVEVDANKGLVKKVK